MKEEKVVIKVRLYPFPAHELDLLVARLGKSRQEIIADALIHYSAYWREYEAKGGSQKNMD